MEQGTIQNVCQPIDINYKKITEWLVAKQKLPRDWHKRLQAIQAKASEALKDVPKDLLNRSTSAFPLLPDSTANAFDLSPALNSWEPSGFSNLTPYEEPQDFFRTLGIRDLMVQECSSRTIFGGLTGQAALWDKVVKAYEKQNVYLGEATITMAQAADHDLPFVRQLIAKLSQQVSDLERKAAEMRKSAAASVVVFKQECERLNIACPTSPSAAPESGDSASSASSLSAHGRVAAGQGLQMQPPVPSVLLSDAAIERALVLEIRRLTGTLRGLIQEGLDQIQNPDVRRVMEYYQAFTEVVHGVVSAAVGADTRALGNLPTLAAVRAGQLAEEEKTEVGDFSLDAFGDALSQFCAGVPEGSVAGVTQNNPDLDPSSLSLLGGTEGAGEAGEEQETSASAEVKNLSVGQGDGLELPTCPVGVGNFSTVADGDEGDSSPADVALTTPTLDWGIDLGALDLSAMADMASSADASASAPIEVNWDFGDIVLEGEGADGSAAFGFTDEEVTTESVFASITEDLRVHGNEIWRLVTDGQFRAMLLDDLQELRAFLTARMADPSPVNFPERAPSGVAIAGTGDAASPSGGAESSSVGDLLRDTDACDLKTMLAAVDTCLSSFCSPRVKELLLIVTSDRYRRRLLQSLLKKGSQEGRLLAAADQIDRRRRQVSSDLAEASRQVSVISDRTRKMKRHVERKISELAGGQTVNIFGDINSALAATT